MDLKVYREHTKVTRRFKEAELVLKNAKIINVFTNEIITGDIAIEDGVIVGIGNYEGKQEHVSALDLLTVIFIWNRL